MALSYGTPYGWDIVEIPSYPNINKDSNFGGNNVKFTIEQEPSYCYNGKNCYISVQLDIKQIRETGDVKCLEPIINSGSRTEPTKISVPYLSNNPGGVLFDTIKCNFRKNEIINLQNAGSVNTMYRMLYESKAEQKSGYSTNAINPLSI